MNYYYDLLLNFNEEYYKFYEWESNDIILYIKKIPLYHINHNTYIEILTNKIKIDNKLLNSIRNNTKCKNDFIEYACIFSDGKNSIAVEFNKEGISINKSSLLLDDELNINEFIYSVNKTNIQYNIISSEIINNESRQDRNIKKIIKLEIDNIYNNNELSKMKYLYLEWFNKLDNNINKMYNDMLNRLNNKLTSREYKIYELIKITYNV